MRRIFFIVFWVFTFLFGAGIAGIAGFFVLDLAGFDSAGDFLGDKLMPFILYPAPIIGLALGFLGYLPGTKEHKTLQFTPMREPLWTAKWAQYLMLRIVLFFLFALVTFPIAIFAIWVVNTYNAQSESILIIPVLAYYFGLLWFSNKTAKYMTFENQTLLSATKSALVDLKIRLAFLPVIGGWFAPDDGGSHDKNHDR